MLETMLPKIIVIGFIVILGYGFLGKTPGGKDK